MSEWPALDFGELPDEPVSPRDSFEHRAEAVAGEEAEKAVARTALGIARPSREGSGLSELMLEAARQTAEDRARTAAEGAYLERETAESEVSLSVFAATSDVARTSMREEARRAARELTRRGGGFGE